MFNLTNLGSLVCNVTFGPIPVCIDEATGRSTFVTTSLAPSYANFFMSDFEDKFIYTEPLWWK